ncbi:MAG TPA: tetratricopeptide repeat protein [Thermoanaerobaculia bacterium]|jgi:tetratricopeptide (TPR) repeat protein
MKRSFAAVMTVLAIAGCSMVDDLKKTEANAYEKPFYAKYLNTGSDLDRRMQRTLEALRKEPANSQLHNELGTMLVEKGFPKDAEREFERSVNAQPRNYTAWYNLGLVRAANGDPIGARRAFDQTVELKPGHAAALFQLGLIAEKQQHVDQAVRLYAKAFSINRALLDVVSNPRILDSHLVDLALLRMYAPEHTRGSMQFQGVPQPSRTNRPAEPAASPQQKPKDILTPAAPATDPSQQPTAASVIPNPTDQTMVPRTRRRSGVRAPTNPNVNPDEPVPIAPPPAATNT